MCQICQTFRPYFDDCDYSDLPTTGADGSTVSNLPIFTYDQIATQLTEGYWDWSQGPDGERAFDLDANGGVLTYDVSGLTAAGRALAREALEAWSEITGIQFVEVTPGPFNPNNTITESGDAAANTSTAYTMQAGDRFVGQLSPQGERDFVRISLQAGETYTISLTGNTLNDPFLRVYASNGTTQVAFDDDGGGNFDSELTFTATSTGTYYISAGSWNDEGSGTYFVDVQTGDQSADITFDDEEPGAYAGSSLSGGTITSSFVNISTDWIATYGTGTNSYSYQTYMHEIGHALGLGHAGNYNGNATFPTDALYANDSWQATVMSYFSQSENTSVNASRGFTLTPMMADIIAIQSLYGASTTTRLGSTTYGDGNSTGNDIFNLSGTGVLTLYDNGGIDTINLASRLDDQRISLVEETFSDINGRVGNLGIARDTVIENVITGSGDDTILGNSAANRVTAGTGNDSILGELGNDTLLGGGGFDTIEGGNGADSILGGDQADLIFGGNGSDRLFGGQGTDNIYGDVGNDFLSGGTEDDRLFGGDGADTLYGGSQDDRLLGEAGNDRLFGDGGFDHLDGGDGNDVLAGGGQADNLYGRLGDDTLSGEDGADRIFAGAGNDLASGGAGNDVFFAGQGDDTVRGDDGDDRIFAGAGNDEVGGGTGNDEIVGGVGFDTLTGGLGDDTLTGSFNADTFVFAGAFGADVITDFAATNDFERIDLSGVASITDFADLTANHLSQMGSDVVIDAGGGNTITLEGVTLADLDAVDFVF